MVAITAPTCRQLLERDGDLKFLDQELDDSYRHGNYVTDYYLRVSDNTHWAAHYTKDGDGEHSGLLDGDADIVRVKPVTVTRTEYVRC